jgi:hypothetical protein
MISGKLTVQISVKGRTVTEFKHQDQIFIEGRPGSDFEITVGNMSPVRAQAIISVDGLSITDGKLASEDSSGYLVPAYGTVTIPGWMLDNNQVAKFTFSSRKDSYAQQGKGNATNCGVIGVMLFAEKVKPIAQPYNGLLRSYNAGGHFGNSMGTTCSTLNATPKSASSGWWETTATTTAATTSVNNLGTEFGASTQFQTVNVEFERGSLLNTAAIYYDDSRGLKARGIIIERASRQQYQTTPNPFPASSMGCIPPKTWNR